MQRCYKLFDKLKFKEDLVKVNSDGFCLNANPNDVVVHFLKIVNKLLVKHAPYKTIKYAKPQNGNKPWITQNKKIKKKKKKKKKIVQKFLRRKRSKNTRIFRKEIQIIPYMSLLRETKDSYYKPYFEDNKKNLRLV